MKKGESGKYFVFRVYINKETDKELCEQLASMPNHLRNAHVKHALKRRINTMKGSDDFPNVSSMFSNPAGNP